MESNVQKVMELIDTLTPDEKKIIYMLIAKKISEQNNEDEHEIRCKVTENQGEISDLAHYKKMNGEINGKLLDFFDTVNERAEEFPISMDEITKEVKKARPL